MTLTVNPIPTPIVLRGTPFEPNRGHPLTQSQGCPHFYMNKKGLTLLEIIISTLILSLVMIGMVNLFISGKRWLLHSRSRMVGAELGKYFLDPLQQQVRQDTWNDPTNCLGTGNCTNETVNTAQGNYTAQYNTNPNTPITNLTRVVVNITWNETSP